MTRIFHMAEIFPYQMSNKYRIVASTSLSCFGAHAGLFRLIMKWNSMLIYFDILYPIFF